MYAYELQRPNELGNGQDRDEQSDHLEPTTSPELTVSNLDNLRSSSSQRRKSYNDHGQANVNVDISEGSNTYETLISDLQAGARWRIHWRSPTLIVCLFLAGIVFAIGHHFYYASLDGTPVTSGVSQQWATRIGTGLAFLSKACLAASVSVAFTQRLWVTVKKKPISLGSLDNVFSLTTDPLAFLSFEVLFSAKILSLLAVCVW